MYQGAFSQKPPHKSYSSIESDRWIIILFCFKQCNVFNGSRLRFNAEFIHCAFKFTFCENFSFITSVFFCLFDFWLAQLIGTLPAPRTTIPPTIIGLPILRRILFLLPWTVLPIVRPAVSLLPFVCVELRHPVL